MTDNQLCNTLRDGLSLAEQPWYDAFVVAHKREPECMWELMCWSSNTQVAQRQFWEALW